MSVVVAWQRYSALAFLCEIQIILALPLEYCLLAGGGGVVDL